MPYNTLINTIQKNRIMKYTVFEKILQEIIPYRIITEHKFHPVRKFLFDYCVLELKLAIEIEGGVWKYGRHNRADGFIKDIEKYNLATSMGWTILRFTPDMLNKSGTIDIIKETVGNLI